MYKFTIISEKVASFVVDLNIYTQTVLTKVNYWLGGNFCISVESKNDYAYVTIETNDNNICWDSVKQAIAQKFTDFQMREIIETETKDIRTILYIKAFANLDEFQEYEV